MDIVTKEIDNSKARDDMWATVYAQVFVGLVVNGISEDIANEKAQRAAEVAWMTVPKTVSTTVVAR